MRASDFAEWVRAFERESERRRDKGDPDWTRGARLDPAVVRSVQRFQVGEDGDGADLLRKAEASDDADYAAAARLFVAEEQNHGRLLARLLTSAGARTATTHWSDAVFVRLRRAWGLRWELMVLMLAEVIALRYYRALRDGAGDALTTDVAGRILEDEQRHVPFHCHRLRESFARVAGAPRVVVAACWWVVMLGATAVVVWDHGSALRRLGVGRTEFAADVIRLFRGVVTDVLAHDRP